MRFIHFIFLFVATGCGASHTVLLDDMESVAIGMLEVSRDVACQDPNGVDASTYDCEYEGELSVRVYEARVGDEDATGVVDIGFIGAQLDLITVDGFGDMVVYESGEQASLVGSFEVDDEREYEDLFIEVTLRSDNEMYVEGIADDLQFSFDLVRFSGAPGPVEPQEDCGALSTSLCE